MKNIIISILIRFCCISSLFILINPSPIFAQDKTNAINAELNRQSFYKDLPKLYYIAVMPIQGCFTCQASLNGQIKTISQNDKIIIIYPSTRKIVEDKIKKENNLDKNTTIYIFDDIMYRKFYDDNAPKGYTLKVKKQG